MRIKKQHKSQNNVRSLRARDFPLLYSFFNYSRVSQCSLQSVCGSSKLEFISRTQGTQVARCILLDCKCRKNNRRRGGACLGCSPRELLQSGGLINWICRLQLIYYAIVLHADKLEKDLSGRVWNLRDMRALGRFTSSNSRAFKINLLPECIVCSQFPLLSLASSARIITRPRSRARWRWGGEERSRWIFIDEKLLFMVGGGARVIFITQSTIQVPPISFPAALIYCTSLWQINHGYF